MAGSPSPGKHPPARTIRQTNIFGVSYRKARWMGPPRLLLAPPFDLRQQGQGGHGEQGGEDRQTVEAEAHPGTDRGGQPQGDTGGQPGDLAAAGDHRTCGQHGGGTGDRLEHAQGVDAQRIGQAGGGIDRIDRMQGQQREGGGGKRGQHVGAQAGRLLLNLALHADHRPQRTGKCQPPDHRPGRDLEQGVDDLIHHGDVTPAVIRGSCPRGLRTACAGELRPRPVGFPGDLDQQFAAYR